MNERTRPLERVSDQSTISYKVFKELSETEISPRKYIVSNLSPSKLWASQDWVSVEKIVRTSMQELRQEALVLPAYYCDIPRTGQRAIILANGHHHALRASEQGIKVSVSIIGELPKDREMISFSRYRRETGIQSRDI